MEKVETEKKKEHARGKIKEHKKGKLHLHVGQALLSLNKTTTYRLKLALRANFTSCMKYYRTSFMETS